MATGSSRLVLCIAFVEGAVLMSNELLGSKLLSTGFGVSIQAWAVLLSVTLLSLSTGYYAGGKFYEKSKDRPRSLLYLLALCTVVQFTMNYSHGVFRELFLQSGLLTGSILFSLCMIFPIVFLAGIFSPFLIGMLAEEESNKGSVAGKVYAISTCGGIIATFLFGLYFIPEKGVHSSILLLSLILAGLTLVYAAFSLTGKKNVHS